MEKPRRKDNPGPPPGRVKINKPWEKPVKDALQKKCPKDGWPKTKKDKKGRGT
jgi:hypothetical protein